MSDFETRLKQLASAIREADAIVIGAGAGLSAAAGLTYSGERFTENFAEYIAKYRMKDMYSAGFYPFKSQEAKWGYWSRHIHLNRHLPDAFDIYQKLKKAVDKKAYFVITTNVDYQFYKAGFDEQKIFAPQGDYGKWQCSTPCHETLYDNEDLITRMVSEQKNCLIPATLVPKCPVCGGTMEINIRIDQRFVQDDHWKNTARAYQDFMRSVHDKKVVLLECGIGFNTPSIIKFPFEQLAAQSPNVTLVRINRDYPEITNMEESRAISFSEDVALILDYLIK